MTGTPDTSPGGEDPAAEARRLGEELERARYAGSPVPAPDWPAMDQSTRAAELAELAEWVTRVLVPSQAWPRGGELRPCWRAHWPVIWELGVIWAEWRRVYGRDAPELAGALELAGRWLPGALERVHRALADCRPHECILAATTPRRPT